MFFDLLHKYILIIVNEHRTHIFISEMNGMNDAFIVFRETKILLDPHYYPLNQCKSYEFIVSLSFVSI